MQTLAQATTPSDYTQQATLIDVSANRIKYKIANASVYVQLMPRNPHGGEDEWTPEFLATPEDGAYSNVIGIRFRSATVGQPAQVLAQSFSPGDPVAEGAVPVVGTLLASGVFVSQGVTLLNALQAADLVLSQAFQAQTGASVSFTVAGPNARLMAVAHTDLFISVTGVGLCLACLFLDGVQVTTGGILNDPGAINRGTVDDTFVGAVAPGAHTIEMRARKLNAGGTATAFAGTNNSRLSVMVVDA